MEDSKFIFDSDEEVSGIPVEDMKEEDADTVDDMELSEEDLIITNDEDSEYEASDNNDDEEDNFVDSEEISLDAKWTRAYINRLPDEAFAVILPGGETDETGRTKPRSLRKFPHHNMSVKDPDDNDTVDLPHLRNALARLPQSKIPAEYKARARRHLERHAQALGVGDRDSFNYKEFVSGIAKIVENINDIDELDKIIEMTENIDNNELNNIIVQKLNELSAKKTKFQDIYEGKIVDKVETSNGIFHFKAIVAQADKINENGRLYPLAEFEKNIKRANRLAKAGKLLGSDGHPGLFSGDKPSEICIRWDAVWLEGNNLVMEGHLIPTDAGRNLATLWEHGVNFEWSIIGYGDGDEKTTEDGETYLEIRNYVLLGCDAVRWGAAETKTISIEPESQKIELNESNEFSNPKEVETEVDDNFSDTSNNNIDIDDSVSDSSSDSVIDSDESLEEVINMEDIKSVVQEELKAYELQRAKDEAIARISAESPELAKVAARHFDECSTIEEVRSKEEEIKPLLEALKKPKTVEGTAFIHTGDEREKFFYAGNGKVVNRPETVDGVKKALLESLSEQAVGRRSNLVAIGEAVLKNYESSPELSKYLWACTKRGYQEAATTTAVMTATTPQVLPILMSVLPKLIPYEIAAVVPINGPTVRIPFLKLTYGAGNESNPDDSNLSDSTYFDVTWADHEEGTEKSQIGFVVDYTDITVSEKAIHYEVTSALVQDMQNVYGIDIEQELISAAAAQIARELNYSFLATLAAGAGNSAGTFGTTAPSGIDIDKWLTWGLSQWIQKASKEISKDMFRPATWIVTGPTQAQLLAASNVFEVDDSDEGDFGIGLRKQGVWNGQMDVYVADWAETIASLKNKMLFGYYAEEWMQTAAVFCPYVPIYLSPVESSAVPNTLKRSVSSRNAMAVLQPNGLAVLTIANQTGTLPSFVD